MKNKIAELDTAIFSAVKELHIPDGSLYETEEGHLHMELAEWNEGGRTMTEKGRAEIAAEEAAVEGLLALATRLGFDPKEIDDGDGVHGHVTVWSLKSGQ